MYWLYNWKERLFIVKPETVIKWHRTAFRIFWRWKSHYKGGRPKVSREVIALIKQMANENPKWGAPRIHGELQNLGFDISESRKKNNRSKLEDFPKESFERNYFNWLPYCSHNKFQIASCSCCNRTLPKETHLF